MYINAIVTFLDVIGFKELVKNRTADEINLILSKVKNFAAPQPSKDEAPDYNPKVITFSDCVVRVLPIDTGLNSKCPIGLAYHEVIDLFRAQIELINSGILVRGGVTFGEVFIEDDTIFGPALIDAYELESKYAQYPRIVISNNLISEIRNNPLMKSVTNSVNGELRDLDKFLKKFTTPIV